MKKTLTVIFTIVLLACNTTLSNFKSNSQILDLSNVESDSIPCTCEQGPKELILKNCDIESFGQCYMCWKGIQTLNLMNNNIKQIPDEIVKFEDLEILILNNNEINHVNFRMAQMKNLNKCFMLFNHILVREIDSLQKLMPWCEIKGYIIK